MDSDHKPAGPTSVSPFAYNSILIIVIIALMLTLLACACSSSAVDSPEPDANAVTEDITLTVSGPGAYAFPSSRADDLHTGHQLRFTASLYSSADGQSTDIKIPTANYPDDNLVQRIEQLASSGNTIIFRGVPAGYYFVTLFADYIDAESERDADGRYPDKYYDTHSDRAYITLLAKDEEIFNNHNLDCFIYSPTESYDRTFEKKAGEGLDLNFKLKRCVSRIDVKANSGNENAVKDLTVTSYSVFDNMEILSGTIRAVKTATGKSIQLAVPKNAESGVLLFYYTLADPDGSSGKELKATNFTLNPNDGYAFANDGNYGVPPDRINAQGNLIYKVTGNFLSTTQAPSTLTEINVTTYTGWDDTTQEISD